jgi:hypothetical protein
VADEVEEVDAKVAVGPMCDWVPPVLSVDAEVPMDPEATLAVVPVVVARVLVVDPAAPADAVEVEDVSPVVGLVPVDVVLEVPDVVLVLAVVVMLSAEFTADSTLLSCVWREESSELRDEAALPVAVEASEATEEIVDEAADSREETMDDTAEVPRREEMAEICEAIWLALWADVRAAKARTSGD